MSEAIAEKSRSCAGTTGHLDEEGSAAGDENQIRTVR